MSDSEKERDEAIRELQAQVTILNIDLERLRRFVNEIAQPRGRRIQSAAIPRRL